jgi:hypothetical protein
MALGVVLFVVLAAASLLVTGWILVRIPADYFVGDKPPALWVDRHPVLRWSGHVGKNVLGVFLVALGIVLSLPGIPGQGLLTILIGLMFLDIPGKRRLEKRLIQRPRVLGVINRLRQARGRGPLVFEEISDLVPPRPESSRGAIASAPLDDSGRGGTK